MKLNYLEIELESEEEAKTLIFHLSDFDNHHMPKDEYLLRKFIDRIPRNNKLKITANGAGFIAAILQNPKYNYNIEICEDLFYKFKRINELLS